ncbi:opacity protein-like surface antigen [Methanomicrobium sp. W14]|uniref:hypothetical protein n=1 Tax=Methanomicrobium sp. W14 TaxID=2817839 RepID=UPI001AEB009F|nr:hypothetical protein [Methanomicrobium sp. W14]MBP2132148.1 opacity protein-like surface antigen [Methanomicrobium sp. W14]
MKKLLIMLIATAMLVSFAAAADVSAAGAQTSNDGYTVTFANPAQSLSSAGSLGDIHIDTVQSTIEQGETQWPSSYVSGHYTSIYISLVWQDSSNSLRLKVYAPDGHTFGYYYDDSDGSHNGKIQLTISDPDGIPEGTWYYEVYGDSVSGTESYSI